MFIKSLCQLPGQLRTGFRMRASVMFSNNPNRIGKVSVVSKTRNNMPVQMRNLVTQRGQIDFVRMHRFSQNLLGNEYHRHQMRALRIREIGHFFHVVTPDDAAESGIIGVLHKNHAATVILPEDILFLGMTKRARFHKKTKLTGFTGLTGFEKNTFSILLFFGFNLVNPVNPVHSNSYPFTGLTFAATSLARERASSVVAPFANATPMRRRVNVSGFPNSRRSDCGTRSASSTPSKAMPLASMPP